MSPASVEAGLAGRGGSLETAADGEVRIIDVRQESIGPGIEDDIRVFVTQQRGFRSRGFKGVYLSEQETRIRRYHELIDDYIEGRRSGRGRSAGQHHGE